MREPSDNFDDSADADDSETAQHYDVMSGPPRATDLRAVAATLLQVADQLDACGRGLTTDLGCFEQVLPAAVALSELLASTSMLLEHVLYAYDTPVVQAAYTVALVRTADDVLSLLIASGRLRERALDIHRFLTAITLRQPEVAGAMSAPHRTVMHYLTTVQRRGRSYRSH